MPYLQHVLYFKTAQAAVPVRAGYCLIDRVYGYYAFPRLGRYIITRTVFLGVGYAIPMSFLREDGAN